MPPLETAKNRLQVEGDDDKWVAINLMRRHGVQWDATEDFSLPYVHPCQGVDPLLESIEVAVKTYERLGLLIDADMDLVNRWKQIADRLRDAGLQPPTAPEAAGTIMEGLDPDKRVGIWLMPNNVVPGNLEDFLGALVPTEDPCWPHAEKSSHEAKNLGAPFPESDFPKAHVHTWLAWQENPGRPFGTALTACYFNHDSKEALAFVSWFRRLFFDE